MANDVHYLNLDKVWVVRRLVNIVVRQVNIIVHIIHVYLHQLYLQHIVNRIIEHHHRFDIHERQVNDLFNIKIPKLHFSMVINNIIIEIRTFSHASLLLLLLLLVFLLSLLLPSKYTYRNEYQFVILIDCQSHTRKLSISNSSIDSRNCSACLRDVSINVASVLVEKLAEINTLSMNCFHRR